MVPNLFFTFLNFHNLLLGNLSLSCFSSFSSATFLPCTQCCGENDATWRNVTQCMAVRGVVPHSIRCEGTLSQIFHTYRKAISSAPQRWLKNELGYSSDHLEQHHSSVFIYTKLNNINQYIQTTNKSVTDRWLRPRFARAYIISVAR